MLPLLATWPNGYAAGQLPVWPTAQVPHQVALPVEYTTVGRYGTQHSINPITTSASVVGFKFRSGVVVAADTLVSYGPLARYHDVHRVFKLNSRTVLGAGGDFASFQSIKRTIDEKILYDDVCNDNIVLKPSSLYNWLTKMMYNRRSQMNPLYVDLIVGGRSDNNVFFLGAIDMRGRAHTVDAVATGLGAHLALPLLRERIKPGAKQLNVPQAAELTKKCMEVLYYRDTRACNSYTVALCTKRLCKVFGPFKVNENWNLATLVEGY